MNSKRMVDLEGFEPPVKTHLAKVVASTTRTTGPLLIRRSGFEPPSLRTVNSERINHYATNAHMEIVRWRTSDSDRDPLYISAEGVIQDFRLITPCVCLADPVLDCSSFLSSGFRPQHYSTSTSLRH